MKRSPVFVIENVRRPAKAPSGMMRGWSRWIPDWDPYMAICETTHVTKREKVVYATVMRFYGIEKL